MASKPPDPARHYHHSAIAGILRRALTIALLLIGLGAGVWFEREVLLRGLADLWIVSDPVTRGDAVVVLGGGLDVRPFAAADLYQKGLVSKVLVSHAADNGRSVRIGALLEHTELNRNVLLKLGVPESAIEIIGRENDNLKDEAVALRSWAEHNTAAVVVVPIEIFSARRVRWIFLREFHGTGIRIRVPSVEPEAYSRAEWWKTHRGLIAFQTEVLKYFYYRLRY